MNRRQLLLGAAALPLLPAAASAAPPHHAGHHHGEGKSGEAEAPTGSPAQTPIGPVDTAAKWAIITDLSTGAVLLEKDAEAPMAPSSMTKMMTAYLVYSALKSGKLSLSDELPVSEKAWRMGWSMAKSSAMGVDVNTKIKAEDLIRGMVVVSGNDACIVLAEELRVPSNSSPN